jgi:hypothetical protein
LDAISFPPAFKKRALSPLTRRWPHLPLSRINQLYRKFLWAFVHDWQKFLGFWPVRQIPGMVFHET